MKKPGFELDCPIARWRDGLRDDLRDELRDDRRAIIRTSTTRVHGREDPRWAIAPSTYSRALLYRCTLAIAKASALFAPRTR